MVSKRLPSPTKPSHKVPSLQKVRPFVPSIGIPVEHTSQLTIFRAESAKKVSAVFVFAGAHLHLPNRVAKLLRQTLSTFWNYLPEHRSNSNHEFNGNVANNAHQAQHRAEGEGNGKSGWMDCILPYGSAHVVHQSLRQVAFVHVALDGSWTK